MRLTIGQLLVALLAVALLLSALRGGGCATILRP